MCTISPGELIIPNTTSGSFNIDQYTGLPRTRGLIRQRISGMFNVDNTSVPTLESPSLLNTALNGMEIAIGESHQLPV
jgi:hypothetical protein